jgi:RNA-directed DNA polymerase
VLANFALDGLEKQLLKAFPLLGPGSWRGREAQVHLIRYADDFVITANSREILLNRVKPLVETFLAERGLVLSPEKTLITHVSDGFNFLGQNVRRYPNGKLLIKPSRKSVRSFLTKVQAVVKQLWSAPAGTLIARLNPIIRGWANYHRHVVSKRVFSRMDHMIFHMIWRWAKARHPKKGMRWIRRKYYMRFGHRDWWFFAPNDVPEQRHMPFRLFHANSTPIVRHTLVHSGLNPYDPEWFSYMEERTKRYPVQTALTPMGVR